MIEEFHYVSYDDVDEWQRRGWEVAGPLAGHHGRYCLLMRRVEAEAAA